MDEFMAAASARPEPVADPFWPVRLGGREVSLTLGSGGVLAARVKGREYREVVLIRAFPRSDPWAHLVLTTLDDEEEIGLIERLEDLDEESRQAARADLRNRYLVPRVTAVRAVRQDPGSWTWTVETDRGPMQIIMRNLHDHLEVLGHDRMVLTGVDGRSCEIVSVRALDAQSRRQMAKVL